MRRIAAYAFFSLAAAAPAAADPFIVNTGTPTGPNIGFGSFLYFAGEFSIAETYTIHGIEGYLATNQAGSLTIGIHADGGEIPGALLFSAVANLPAFAPLGWYGVAGLDQVLGPGTYWASFIPSSEVSWISKVDPPDPLTNYAVGGITTEGPVTWIVHAPPPGDPHFYDRIFDVGIRIAAEPEAPPVPEPASLLLLGTGLAGMGVRRWHQKRAHVTAARE